MEQVSSRQRVNYIAAKSELVLQIGLGIKAQKA